jgi:Peptidase family C25
MRSLGFIVVTSIAVVLGASIGCGSSRVIGGNGDDSGPPGSSPGSGGSGDDSGSSGDNFDYLIVAADELAASAARYRDFRSAGYHVDLAMVSDLVGDAADAATASARIQAYVRSRYDARDTTRPMFLLLLGDAQTVWPGDGSGVPTGTWIDPSTSAAVTTDNVYADMNGDDVPEIAVGRITADSDAEADLVRDKVTSYESTHEIGVWDRRLSIFASTSGFGDLIDAAIENLVYDITEAIPYDYDVTMTYARQSSPYVYIPEQFSDQVYRRINEGSLLVAYVGHGSADGFATLDWNGTSYPILDTGRLDLLSVTHKSPILLFVACSTGAFAGGESVSERILAQANAPTAIFASTEESDPYANAVFIYEVSQTFTSLRSPTVGEAFLQAKQRMIQNNDSVRQAIDSIAGLLDSVTQRNALKRSHLYMYTIFGDPGMIVTYPGSTTQVSVSPSTASAGANLTVTATLPGLSSGAEAIVSLESARKVILGAISPVPADGDPSRDGVIVQNYDTANDKVAATVTVPMTGSSLSTTLQIPANLPAGQYHIKVFANDTSNDFTGSAPITVN